MFDLRPVAIYLITVIDELYAADEYCKRASSRPEVLLCCTACSLVYMAFIQCCYQKVCLNCDQFHYAHCGIQRVRSSLRLKS